MDRSWWQTGGRRWRREDSDSGNRVDGGKMGRGADIVWGQSSPPPNNYSTVFSSSRNVVIEQNQTSWVRPTRAYLMQAKSSTPAKQSIVYLGLGAWPALHWVSLGTLPAASSSVPCSACSLSGIWSWLHALNKQTDKKRGVSDQQRPSWLAWGCLMGKTQERTSWVPFLSTNSQMILPLAWDLWSQTNMALCFLPLLLCFIPPDPSHLHAPPHHPLKWGAKAQAGFSPRRKQCTGKKRLGKCLGQRLHSWNGHLWILSSELKYCVFSFPVSQTHQFLCLRDLAFYIFLSLGSTPPYPPRVLITRLPTFSNGTQLQHDLSLFTCQLHEGMESMLNNISGTNEWMEAHWLKKDSGPFPADGNM